MMNNSSGIFCNWNVGHSVGTCTSILVYNANINVPYLPVTVRIFTLVAFREV